MPHHNSSTLSTIAVTDTMAEATTTVVVVVVTVVGVFNNQPGLVATLPAPNNPRALPLPTSVGKIGTTTILMVAKWRTPTRAHCVVSGAQHTTQMRHAPTSWTDRLPECTRPSFPQRAVVLLPPLSPPAPSSSYVHSNTLQCHTTLSRAQRNLRTVHARPCPCQRSNPAKA